MAGICSSKFVEPPTAACTVIALWIDASLRICFVVSAVSPVPARGGGLAMSSQIGWPDGASAE